MASFFILEPPGPAAPEKAAIIRDAFAPLAFFIPPLWLLWHRLWIEAALAFAVELALGALGEAAGFGIAGSALSVLVSIYVGLEGAALRVAALRRRGWRDWGVVNAASVAEAEIRYASALDSGSEDIGMITDHVAQPAPRLAPHPAGPALGMLAYPGRG